jgi:hypothetical protein
MNVTTCVTSTTLPRAVDHVGHPVRRAACPAYRAVGPAQLCTRRRATYGACRGTGMRGLSPVIDAGVWSDLFINR